MKTNYPLAIFALILALALSGLAYGAFTNKDVRHAMGGYAGDAFGWIGAVSITIGALVMFAYSGYYVSKQK
jgi:hypothetical protein